MARNRVTSPRLIEVDREKLIDRIHALQTDLLMLAGWLASDSEPVLTEAALLYLTMTSSEIQSLTPCLRRH